MKKEQITTFCMIGVLFLSGCNYLRRFPLYSEVYIEHPKTIELFSSGLINAFLKYPDTDNAREYFRIKERITDYLDKNSNLSVDIAFALQNIKVILGMDKEQVMLILGAPTKKISIINNIDLWVYKEDRGRIGERNWYYGWGKLKFRDGFLIDIEIQCLKITK